MGTTLKFKRKLMGFISTLFIIGNATAVYAHDVVKLQFSDGRSNVTGVENVNAVLRAIGVRASTLPIPYEAKPIINASVTRPTTAEEQNNLIKIFYLHRGQLLEQIELAGRTPVAPRGGYLGTREGNTAPYPKVYDMKALSPEVHKDVLKRYGTLHVNSSDNGMGLDEVMTVVSGGPFTWVYVLPNGVLARLTVEHVGPNDQAVRLSYPGLGMHAGYMEPQNGLIVAFAHGPESFMIRYEEPSVPHAELLNTNAWVDFSGEMPKLKDKVR